ncbi:hypothetical protein PBN151_3743 [Paenibacillus sp. NAIST15-1]|nr:hypothetical protein PBN151_3743 [Paenibacillus sp. NAIST15-1]
MEGESSYDDANDKDRARDENGCNYAMPINLFADNHGTDKLK